MSTLADDLNERPLLEAAREPRSRWRRKLVNGVFKGYAALGARWVDARAREAQVESIRNVQYGPHLYHRLDIYRPAFAPRPLPVLLYIHGGAFTLCSKDTHRGIAVANAARAQYLVFNIDYRLAPKFRYPAAHEDACRAYLWVAEHCARWGGDPSKIVVAGESAGGNLALAVAVAASYKRPEPWARAVYDCAVRPRAVLPLMPYLQVSNPARQRFNVYNGRLGISVAHDIAAAYLGRLRMAAGSQPLMADPIRVLEECGAPQQPFPRVWSGVGTADPCCEDVHRLQLACTRHHIEVQAEYYDNEVHAFHALGWRAAARRFWDQSTAFLRDIAR